MNSVKELADYIKMRTDNSTRYVVAISGFGGAGKSTISRSLAESLGNATLIHTDDFIAADENGALEGYHLNWEILQDQVIKIARSADTLTSRIYDWSSNRPVFEEIASNKYIIIEGSLWLMQDKFKQYFDTTVWIDVQQDIANARGKKRDNEEYGVNHDELWDSVWGPREKDSFIKLRPDEHAEILLNNNFEK
jgi:uridine kinase